MDYDPQRGGARPRRTVRPPHWMSDYEGYVLPSALEEQYRVREGYAEMTPLLRHTGQISDMTPGLYGAPITGPALSSTPFDLRNIVHQLQEDNRRLQRMFMDMRRQMDRGNATVPPLSLQAMQPGSPYRSAEDTFLSTHPPTAVSLQQNDVLGAVGGAEEEEEWPLPPPPVFLPIDQPDPPPPGPAPPLQQQGIVQELIQRLQNVRVQQAAVPADTQNSVPLPPQVFDTTMGSSILPTEQVVTTAQPPVATEKTYRGPKPSIPEFTRADPRQFARLRLALDNILPTDATERFKYQMLCDHLRFEEALLIADSYSNSLCPFTDTMTSLIKHYGQPHHLSLQRIAELMDEPNIRSSDTAGFRKFALRVRALVGMLEQLGEDGRIELQCGSHVARLLKKLPQDLRAAFRRHVYPRNSKVPSLRDFAEWLEYELIIQEGGDQTDMGEGAQRNRPNGKKTAKRTTTVLLGATQDSTSRGAPVETSSTPDAQDKPKAYCPYCSNSMHFLDQCANFRQLTKEQKSSWIRSNNRCWRCGRRHQAAQCRLRVLCKICRGKHLEALHEVNLRAAASRPANLATSEPDNKSSADVLYLDRRAGCNQVLLKICKVLLRHGEHTLETFAILDDGSERTILLQEATQRLELKGAPESLALRTVRQGLRTINGASVSVKVSPVSHPSKTFTIERAFTAKAP